MAIKTATPYLDLRGKAVEAIEFYKSAFGAKLQSLQKFGDAPNAPPAMKDRVMHAVLQLDNATLFLSDGSPDEKAAPGGVVSVALDLDNAAHARAAFEALSKGGTVFQPLIDAPWGALFGAVQDRYGISWMFNSAK